MARYFLEVSYKGTQYSGFQVQQNARTIQSEIEAALATLRIPVSLTGSSRTDAGVHALQNFFHFDHEGALHPQLLYKLNALLGKDVAVHRLYPVADEAHARFDAIGRIYEYHIHRNKDPFLNEFSYFYPFSLDHGLLQESAAVIGRQHYFYSFSKSNAQVSNYRCTIKRSEWVFDGSRLVYCIEGNRFLRGMVRLLTGAMLKVGRKKISLAEMEQWFGRTDGRSGYAAPAQGLYLKAVVFPDGYFHPAADSLASF